MSRSHQQITNFSGGEITPRLRSRVGSERYQNGCEDLSNFIVLPQGGAARRCGFQNVRGLSEEAVTFPVRQEDNDLCLVIGRNSIALFDDTQSLGFTGFSPYGSVADLDDLYYDQDEDRLDIVTETVRPHSLRLVDGAWQFGPSSIGVIPQYGFSDSLSPGSNNAAYTLTFSGSWTASNDFTLIMGGVESSPILYSGNASTLRARIESALQQVGAQIGLLQGAVSVAEADPVYTVTIGGGDTVTLALGVILGQGDIDVALAAPPGGTGAGLEDVWSDTRGWPRTVAYHEQRRVYGGTPSLPATIWGTSVGGDAQGLFSIGTNDNDGFTFRIKSKKKMAITWMSSKRLLAVGTTGGDVVQFQTPITPSSVQFNRQTARQSASVVPVEVGSETFAVRRGGRKVEDLVYSFATESWQSSDITFPAEHLTRGGIRSADYSAEPDGTMWFVLRTGEVISCTYRRDQEMIAWHKHPLGHNATARSVSVVHRDGLDEVWVTIFDGFTWRTVRLPSTSPDDADEVGWFDMYIRSERETPGRLFSGFGDLEALYLNGVPIRGTADGMDIGTVQILGGQVAAPFDASVLCVGVDYVGRIGTNAYQGGTFGQSQTSSRRWGEMILRVIDSLMPTVNGYRPADRTGDTELDIAEARFDGDLPVEGTSYDSDGRIEIVADLPGPCHVTGVFGVLRAGEG